MDGSPSISRRYAKMNNGNNDDNGRDDASDLNLQKKRKAIGVLYRILALLLERCSVPRYRTDYCV